MSEFMIAPDKLDELERHSKAVMDIESFQSTQEIKAYNDYYQSASKPAVTLSMVNRIRELETALRKIIEERRKEPNRVNDWGEPPYGLVTFEDGTSASLEAPVIEIALKCFNEHASRKR